MGLNALFFLGFRFHRPQRLLDDLYLPAARQLLCCGERWRGKGVRRGRETGTLNGGYAPLHHRLTKQVGGGVGVDALLADHAGSTAAPDTRARADEGSVRAGRVSGRRGGR